MPIVSKAQRRKFAQLLVEGEITPEVYERWNRGAGSKELPERVRPKAKRKPGARKKRTAKRKRAGSKTRTRTAAKRGARRRIAGPKRSRPAKKRGTKRPAARKR